IEHGTGMTHEHMEQAAAAGIPVTPTLVQVENFPAIADQADGKYPRYAAHMRRLHQERFRRVRDMYEAGVQLLVGSDAGGGIPHGSYHEAIRLLAHAGSPAPAIVGAPTHHALTYLGVPGITAGAPADVDVSPAASQQHAAVRR